MIFELRNYLIRLLPSKIKNFLRIIQNVINHPDLQSPKQFFNLYKLNKLMSSGQVAIIPVGFRCFTKGRLYLKLGIAQASLPFDNGFFTPHAVSEILRNQRIDLNFNDKSSQTVCIKNELYTDSSFGLGIKFETSTYVEINDLAKSKDQKDINKYLDSTFGYYTLDKKYNYVLAHYNWHEFSDITDSNGQTKPENNLIKINDLMNKRIQRLVNMCEKAKIIFFIYDETQGYNFMAINNTYFSLNNFESIEAAAKDKFNAKSIVIKAKDIKSPYHMMKIIQKNS
jgi:hypothetical protein